MQQADLKNKIIQQIKYKWPDLKTQNLDSLIAENLFSPFVLELPESVLTQAQDFAKSIHALRVNKQYQDCFKDDYQKYNIIKNNNFSFSSSFDFHLNSENQLKLIEINTNAAFWALGLEMYEAHQLQPLQSYKEIQKAILSEVSLFKSTTFSENDKLNIAIVDDHPKNQRLYIEFLIYKSFFHSLGWTCEIVDSTKVSSDFDFIYNRDTDFFLIRPEIIKLKELYQNKTSCISPHPLEYLLLADKQRMTEWSQPQYFNDINFPIELQKIIHNHLPSTLDLALEDKEKIWNLRKKLFIKPKQAFGSKQSYRGESLSRKLFDGLNLSEFIAQEYVPAPEKVWQLENEEFKFKYDLRFYFYQDKILSCVARLYQGQVTNLKYKNGGFSPVIFA